MRANHDSDASAVRNNERSKRYATDAALSVASAGAAAVGGVVGVVGNQLIKAGISAGKTASRVSFTFIQGGMEALKNQDGSANENVKVEKLF